LEPKLTLETVSQSGSIKAVKRKKTTRKKTARKTVKRRTDIARPHNGGEWTVARMKSFIVSALRGARWPQKYKAISRAFVREGPNPATGKKCKLHRCESCHQLFPQGMMQADHRHPVVGPEGFTTWDEFIRRMFIEEDGYDILCKGCHRVVTAAETAERNLRKKSA
jgi:hypothetical protein